MDSGDSIELELTLVSKPLWLVKADLTPWAKVLYDVLHWLAITRTPYPGHETVATDWLRTSRSTVSRASTELELYGAVTVGRGIIARNTYCLRGSDPRQDLSLEPRPMGPPGRTL